MEKKVLLGHSGDIEPREIGTIEVRKLLNEMVSSGDVSVALITLKGKK